MDIFLTNLSKVILKGKICYIRPLISIEDHPEFPDGRVILERSIVNFKTSEYIRTIEIHSSPAVNATSLISSFELTQESLKYLQSDFVTQCQNHSFSIKFQSKCVLIFQSADSSDLNVVYFARILSSIKNGEPYVPKMSFGMAVQHLSEKEKSSTSGKKMISTEPRSFRDTVQQRVRNELVLSSKKSRQRVQFQFRKRLSFQHKGCSGRSSSDEDSFKGYTSPPKRPKKYFEVGKKPDDSRPFSQRKLFTSTPNVASEHLHEKSSSQFNGNNKVPRSTTSHRPIYKPRLAPKLPTLASTYDDKFSEKNLTDTANKENSDLSFSFRKNNLGFCNIGNTCYMNAVLQSLYSLPTLEVDLLSTFQHIKDVLESKNSVYGAVCSLLKERKKVHSTNSLNYYENNLIEIKSAMDSSCANFQGNRMQDGHEFHIKLIETLHKEITQALSKSTNSNVHNPIEDNFRFIHVETVKCEKCDLVVRQSENDYNIGLSVPKRRINGKLGSLQSSLQLNFGEEQREFTCSQCRHNRSRAKTKIVKVPKILTLFLKRFKFTEDGHTIKDDTPTFVPHFLTLMDFVYKSDEDNTREKDVSDLPEQDVPNQEGDGEHQNVNLDDRFEDNYDTGHMPLSYQLMSVVCHHGDRPDMGHYVCYRVNILGKLYLLYDDKHVSNVSEETFFTDVNNNGYIFLYAKK